MSHSTVRKCIAMTASVFVQYKNDETVAVETKRKLEQNKVAVLMAECETILISAATAVRQKQHPSSCVHQ